MCSVKVVGLFDVAACDGLELAVLYWAAVIFTPLRVLTALFLMDTSTINTI